MNQTMMFQLLEMPLTRRPGLVALLSLVACLTVTAWADTQTQRHVDDCVPFLGGGVELSGMQCHAVQQFFTSLVGYPVSLAESYDDITLRNIMPLVMLRVNAGTAHCWIHAKGDTIVHFSRLGLADRETGIENSILAQAISKEKAFTAALPALTYCKGPAEISEYAFEFIGGWKKPTESLKNCAWIVAHSYTYRGVPCLGPTLRVRISAYSGRLESLDYWPPTSPKYGPTTAISKDTALKTAAGWLKGSRTFGSLRAYFAPDATQNTKKVIAWPNGGNNRDKDPATVPSDEARYYWQVPFSWTEDAFGNTSNTFHATILVDMETSEVIGVF